MISQCIVHRSENRPLRKRPVPRVLISKKSKHRSRKAATRTVRRASQSISIHQEALKTIVPATLRIAQPTNMFTKMCSVAKQIFAMKADIPEITPKEVVVWRSVAEKVGGQGHIKITVRNQGRASQSEMVIEKVKYSRNGDFGVLPNSLKVLRPQTIQVPVGDIVDSSVGHTLSNQNSQDLQQRRIVNSTVFTAGSLNFMSKIIKETPEIESRYAFNRRPERLCNHDVKHTQWSSGLVDAFEDLTHFSDFNATQLDE